MSEIVFTSVLGQDHKDELERLLFFNGNQSRSVDAASFVAKQYGVPRIQIASERLRIGLDSAVETQTLFAVRRAREGDEPLGVAVYTREDESFVVLFMAVHEDYSSRGPRAADRVMMRLTAAIKDTARRVRGISAIVIHVGNRKPIRMSVRR